MPTFEERSRFQKRADAVECLAIINQKGGVGKTSTTANLGAALALRGKRVLLIDMDPQAHLTTHFGLDEKAAESCIYEVLTCNLPLESAIYAYSEFVSIIPTRIDLAAAETELVSVVGREVILRDALAIRELPFDLILLDCPPSLGVLTLNALSAANRVLIPVQPHFLALQGAGRLFETIALVNQRLNAELRVCGMIMCMYESGTRLASEVIDDLSSFLESYRDQDVPWQHARIFNTRIRRNIKLAECPSYGQSIFEYAPRSNGAVDHLALADELLELIEMPSSESVHNPKPTEESEPNVLDTPPPQPATTSITTLAMPGERPLSPVVVPDNAMTFQENVASVPIEPCDSSASPTHSQDSLEP